MGHLDMAGVSLMRCHPLDASNLCVDTFLQELNLSFLNINIPKIKYNPTIYQFTYNHTLKHIVCIKVMKMMPMTVTVIMTII